MTGSNKVWRAPVAGLASVAMLATLGVSAMTANAAEGVASTTFVPATSAATYTVTVNANGGKFTANYETAVEAALSDTEAVSFNESKTVATIKDVPATLDGADVTAIFGNANVSNTNRTLSGFYSGQQAGEGVRVDNPAGITLSGDMTAYAHWYATSDVAKVTFNSASPVSLAPGDKLAAWQIPSYQDGSTNQVADYWQLPNGEKVTTDIAFDAGTTDLTPHMCDTVKITYKPVDSGLGSGININGSNAAAYQYVAAGKAFAPDVTAVPSDTHNVFIGWYEVKADADAAQVDASELADKPFDFDAGTKTDVTLYAKVGTKEDAHTCTVTYYLKSGTVYGTDTVYDNGLTTVNEPPTPTDPTDQGRPFKFWTSDSSATTNSTPYDFDTAVPAAGLNLYAVWGDPTVSNKTATFDPNYSGSNVIVVKANGNGSFTAPEVEREGYEFDGWYHNDSTHFTDKFNADKTDYANASVFYAKWTRAGMDELTAAYTLIDDADKVFTEDSLKAYNEAYKAAQKKYGATADAVKSADIEAATEAMQAAQALLVVNDSTDYTSPVYRVYNKAENKHLYTTNQAEYQRLLIQGWRDEGIAFYAVKASAVSNRMEESGLYVKVHRLYDKPAARHLYTTDDAEYQKLVAEGWRDEGTAFYARTQGGAEVYRAYSPSRYEHLFTTNQSEYETATTAQGEGWYRAEGVKFNVEK